MNDKTKTTDAEAKAKADADARATAELKAKNPKAASHPALSVKASIPQRCRAGIMFGQVATIVEADTLSAAQLEALAADPFLSAMPVNEEKSAKK